MYDFKFWKCGSFRSHQLLSTGRTEVKKKDLRFIKISQNQMLRSVLWHQLWKFNFGPILLKKQEF